MADALNDRMLEMMRRLKNLRDHESSNVNEAASAAASLQNLLLKYNLEEATLEQLSGAKPVYGKQMFDVSNGGPKNLCAWKAELMHVIAITNMCRALHHYDTHAQASPNVSVIGQRHNIAVVKGLYDYLATEFIRLADLGWAEYKREFPDARRRHYTHWFCMGAKNVIYNRLKKQQEADSIEHAAQWGLVVIKEGQLQEAYDRMFPKASAAGKSKPKDGDKVVALLLGKKAAEGINLDRQLESAEQQAMAIGSGV